MDTRFFRCAVPFSAVTIASTRTTRDPLKDDMAKALGLRNDLKRPENPRPEPRGLIEIPPYRAARAKKNRAWPYSDRRR
jgi:hypothetical protein